MKNWTKMLSRTFGLIAVVILLGSSAFAQSKITVKGKVFEADANDNKGETIPFATVKCVEDGVGKNTDLDGEFSLEVERRDSVRLIVTYGDYPEYLLTFAPEKDKDTYEFEILMKEATSTSTMDDVVITGSKFKERITNVPISMATVKPRAIDIQASNNIEKVLEQVPGVDIRDGQPQIRGSSGYAYGAGSRVMVMLDGLPLLSADAAFAQFDMIPSDNIQQIEIMKGASSVLYGSSALGGVINVISGEAGYTPKTSVRFKTTVYDRPANQNLDWDGNSSANILSAHIFHSRKINRRHDVTLLLDLVKDSGYRQGTGRKQLRPMIMTKFRPKGIDGLTFGFNSSYKVDSSGTFLYWSSYHPDTMIQSYLPPDNFPPVTDTIRDTILGRGALVGSAGTQRYQLNDRITFDPFVQYLDSAGRLFTYRGRILQTRNRNSTNQSSTNRVYYNDFQYLFPILDNHVRWAVGATGQVNTVNADTTFYAEGSHLSYSLAGYTQLDGKFFGEPGKEKLNLSVGGRFERITIDPQYDQYKRVIQRPIFRAGAAFEPMRGTNIRASWGQAFRAPSVAELFTATAGGGLVIEPNPALKSENGYSMEVGLKQGFRFGNFEGGPGLNRGVQGFIDAAVFRMEFENMIEFGLSNVAPPEPPSIFPTPLFSARNVTNARIDGLEVTGIANIDYYNWYGNISGGVTILDPQNLNPTPDSAQVVLDPYAAAQQGLNPFNELNLWATGVKADNPATLKYRSRYSAKFSATGGYKNIGLTCNYRFNSQIETVDQFLLLAVPQSGEFLATHGSNTVVDFILAYDFTKDMRISFHLDNAFNEEYVIIPGILAEQRKFTIQYKYVF